MRFDFYRQVFWHSSGQSTNTIPNFLLFTSERYFLIFVFLAAFLLNSLFIAQAKAAREAHVAADSPAFTRSLHQSFTRMRQQTQEITINHHKKDQDRTKGKKKSVIQLSVTVDTCVTCYYTCNTTCVNCYTSSTTCDCYTSGTTCDCDTFDGPTCYTTCDCYTTDDTCSSGPTCSGDTCVVTCINTCEGSTCVHDISATCALCNTPPPPIPDSSPTPTSTPSQTPTASSLPTPSPVSGAIPAHLGGAKLPLQGSQGEMILGLGGLSGTALSPDGKTIATWGTLGAFLWDAESHQLLQSFGGHSKRVTSLAFSPDGDKVLTGSWDSTAKLWDVETGIELRTFQGHSSYIDSVAYSPDGTKILTGGWDDTAKLWEAETGTVIRTFEGHTNDVTCVAFSADGTKVLTCSLDETAKVWDTSTGGELLTLQGHTDWVMTVAFSPNGTKIITGGYDNTAKLWDAVSGSELQTYEGHTGKVYSVAFSPDGNKVLTGSWDFTTKLWNAETGVELQTYKGHNSGVNSVSFSPDGRKILTGSWDNTVKLWDVETGMELRNLQEHTNWVMSVTFSPDGSKVLIGSRDDTAQLWDAVSGTKIRTFQGHTSNVYSVAFSPDGSKVITGSSDDTAKLWDSATGSELHTFQGHTNNVNSVAFGPYGAKVITGSSDETAKLWHVSTGAELQTFKGHSDSVRSVAISPDGSKVLTGGADNTIRLWDVATGAELRIFEGHTDNINSVAFSPDGSKILTGSSDNTVKLWDLATGAELRTFEGHTDSVYSVAFSPDGTKILTGIVKYSSNGRVIIPVGNFEAKLWETETGMELQTFRGHTWYVYSVAFSPDGTKVVTGSVDGTARIWNLDDTTPVATSTPIPTPTLTNTPTVTPPPIPANTPTPIPSPTHPDTPGKILFDFNGETDEENEVITMGAGYGEYPLPDIQYDLLPVNNSFEGATDGRGMIVTADPGEGTMIITRDIFMTNCALVRCSVRSSAPHVSIYIATVDLGESEYVSTLTPNSPLNFVGQYNRIADFFLPPSTGFKVLVQVINTSESESATVYIDNLEVIKMGEDRIEVDVDEIIASGYSGITPTNPPYPTHTNTPTPMPTTTPTPPSPPQEAITIPLDLSSDATQLEMIWIEPGTFMMGSPPSEEGRWDDEKLHEVTLTQGFYISKYEITMGQWQAVMNDITDYEESFSHFSMSDISWNETQNFIDELNQLFEEYKFRLPTEAEWEYACRAGTTTRFYWGEDPNLTMIDEYAAYEDNTYDPEHDWYAVPPVGSFEPNDFGLYDMSGSMYEFCQDWGGVYPDQPVVDPTGPDNGELKVIRGGSYSSEASYCRSAFRNFAPVDENHGYFGLRLVMTQN